MGRLLLINCRFDERRVALLENGVTTELFVEPLRDRGLVGNIYKGRVVRVLPGMQSAFVELGLARTGFLFVGDVARPVDDSRTGEFQAPSLASSVNKYPPISTVVKEGQELLVQVAKEPMGTKGARLTTQLSLPGRNLVYLPTLEHVGVSRRIVNVEERERLRTLAEEVCPEEGGVIIRTAAEGVDASALRDDVDFLQAVWKDVQRKVNVSKAPELVHEDVAVTMRSVRDLLVSSSDRVLVDDAADAAELKAFVARFMPGFEQCIETWTEHESLFSRFGVDLELRRALARKVWLRSGGYILIEETEALTAIDVNSGRYVGAQNFEETVLELNLEAVREIAYQLRLRDIGGIIIIDFIDMQPKEHQQRVHKALVQALEADKARTRVLSMSAFGLIEMTRKRVRESIVKDLTEPCLYCDGQGYLRSVKVIAEDLMARLREQAANREKGQLVVQGHPRVTEHFVDRFSDEVDELQRRYNVEIYVTPRDDLHLDHVQIR